MRDRYMEMKNLDYTISNDGLNAPILLVYKDILYVGN
jgi:hypothetical protein